MTNNVDYESDGCNLLFKLAVWKYIGDIMADTLFMVTYSLQLQQHIKAVSVLPIQVITLSSVYRKVNEWLINTL